MKLITVLIITLLIFPAKKVGKAFNTKVNNIDVTFDPESIIRRTLKKENIDCFTIELIIAQSKHESGNYKNSLTQYNNIFARHYHKIDTFAISAGACAEGHDRFAKYPSLEYATLSQLAYFKRKGYSMKWKSTNQFALELKQKGYYEAPIDNYNAALNRIIQNEF
jgi:hypothetical protein